MAYTAWNLSLINSSNIVPFIQTVDEHLMFGYYGIGILITLFVLFLMGFQAYTNDWIKSLGTSSLMIAIFSILFRGLGLVNDVAVLVSWVAAAIFISITFLTD